MPAVRARHSNPTFDALENVPQVLTLIFAQLDTQDLVRARQVKRRWLEAADADEVWKARCEQTYPLVCAMKRAGRSEHLSYRQLVFQQKRAKDAARGAGPSASALPNPQDYLLGVEICKVGDPTCTTRGEALFAALVDFDLQCANQLAHNVMDGSTGTLLRAGAAGDYGTKVENDCLVLRFHVDVFLVRKRDGRTLSLCAGTSGKELESSLWTEGINDSVARPLYDDVHGDRNSTYYCWLVPGTGEDPIPPARLELQITHSNWHSDDDFYDAGQHTSLKPEFDEWDYSMEESEWDRLNTYWEVPVTSISVDLCLDDDLELFVDLEDLLGILESTPLRHRWV
jgi:hypothetical protein